ncbi:hypothetical protein BBO99_00007841 [Phytophthora kernoviae]|uniref:Uncharacterized protein n=2 Tax=Phytophthora kernoviae TaxID=325452 RepID=A0A3R7GUY4_9STRA|nr:hypothetical protein G195_009105 [Phytophthora kernoviae 00238/432]KAG2516477.1 hypothetical protein JM16_007653 [Phytophthora kernoviae]KAG2519501.1 hypothetical protein JM18_006979 [Phytophthora kernoviae]RLN38025.1 hypothetical protein BBI17_007882 [Phytophthora kernoviae]RLN76072.1 hypothetical protein BBO99_00007841 [Phytophthora kernoviae]
MLTLIYPLCIFGLTSLDGIHQAFFVVLLLVIKIGAKNWINRALTGHNDLKPEAVIFNMEVFNALYISNAIQNALSWTSTAAIMALDVIILLLSVVDVIEVLNEVTVLMKKILRGHPIVKEHFVQRGIIRSRLTSVFLYVMQISLVV